MVPSGLTPLDRDDFLSSSPRAFVGELLQFHNACALRATRVQYWQRRHQRETPS